ncbi:glycosyltransferase [Nocardia terpenica]|uniref:Glycosyltransferase n=1 Tax=Nocardia terpenica TaxID=455432 RepID=A0A6G9Z5Q4_9NOCA|nr:glycosyltransferase [Nocardia terpenica]QIS20929.1 glycosyltransferase [Nocardia terpenica]
MAKVVIVGFGTRGDVAPLIGVGVRLREAGHEVVLTAPSEFAELVAACGLRWLPFDIYVAPSNELDGKGRLQLGMELLTPAGLLATGRALLDTLRDEEADILLLSPYGEFAGHALAEARGIPSMGVRLQPVSTTADHAPAMLTSLSAGPLGNRAIGYLTAAAIDRIYASTVAGLRDHLGLPRVSAAALRRRRTAAEWPILHGYSHHIAPRPADWRPGLDVVGYWWPPRPEGWQPPPEVVSFLEAGPPPVFVGFGSLNMSKAEAARLSELVPRALRIAGVRGVVQAGWAGLNVESDSIITLGDIPHDWLFDRVSAVIHACGAGIAAAGLRAGAPAITIPASGTDQPFWAKRLRVLGVSAATLSRRRLTAERLAEAIDSALTNPTYRATAEHLAAKIAAEDGAAEVVTAVERLAR